MRTWKAALLHVGISAAQAAAGVQFFAPTSSSNYFKNLGIQLGTQFGLTAFNVWAAMKNSNTDPQGNQLFQSTDNRYYTIPPSVPSVPSAPSYLYLAKEEKEEKEETK